MPIILEYFIPGLIFISVFQYFTSRKFNSYVIIYSVAISYILKAVCSALHNRVFTDITFEWNLRAIILSAIAFILSILCVFISELKILNKITLGINNKCVHNDIWLDVIEYRKGTTLRFVCDDAIYTGKLVKHEENGNDSWFVLDEYIIEENNIKRKAKDMSYPTKLAINLKDVKRVELYYGKKQKSKVREWLENNKILGRFFKEQEN